MNSLLASSIQWSNILRDQVCSFGSGSIDGLPIGTEEDPGGRHSPLLHRFVTDVLSGVLGQPYRGEQKPPSWHSRTGC